MAQRDYSDFDLALSDLGDGRYRVRVLASPSGQAGGEFSLPFSELEMENFLLRIGRPRRGVRRLESSEAKAARDFGRRLCEAVFSGEVGVAWQRSLDTAERQERGLRLRLRLGDAPELAAVPWEYLYLPTGDRHLVLSTWTPLVRYLDLPRAPRPLTVQPPLRLLAMISSPANYPALDTDAEWSKLDESLGPLEADGMVEVTRLERASLQSLQRALRRTEYHVFHFMGHGGFDEQSSDGVLVLENDDGGSRRVTGRELGTILTDARSVRLAVLNSCEGARSSGADPFGGTAPALVTGGIPAVVAMQFEITDRAAIVFAHELYAAVADGYPIDAAVAEARRAIFGAGNDVEWGTPVLYMRADDGRLFDFAQSEPDLATPAPATPDAADIEDDASSEDSVGVVEAKDAADEVPVDKEGGVDEPPVETERRVVVDLPLPTLEDEIAAARAKPWAGHTAEGVTAHPESDDGLPFVALQEPADPLDLSTTVELELGGELGDEPAPTEPAGRGPAQPPPSTPVEADEPYESPDPGISPRVEKLQAPSAVDPKPREAVPRHIVAISYGGAALLLALVALFVVLRGDSGAPEGLQDVDETTDAAADGGVPAALQVVDDTTVVAVAKPDGLNIDGDLSDWSSVTTAYVLKHVVFQHQSGVRAGQDSTATIRVAYDDQGLYLAVEADDDRYAQANVGDQIWRGDAIDINLSTVPPEEASATPDADDFQLTMTPFNAAGLASHAWFKGVGADTFRGAETDRPITLAALPTTPETTYTLEAFIPWQVFELDGLPDDDLTALFAVFDNDGEMVDGQSIQRTILGNVPDANFQDPNTWGRLVLAP